MYASQYKLSCYRWKRSRNNTVIKISRKGYSQLKSNISTFNLFNFDKLKLLLTCLCACDNTNDMDCADDGL